MTETNWDTNEVLLWAMNDEYVWTECDRLAKKYKYELKAATRAIRNTIRSSHILVGKGIRTKAIDWEYIAKTFIEGVG